MGNLFEKVYSYCTSIPGKIRTGLTEIEIKSLGGDLLSKIAQRIKKHTYSVTYVGIFLVFVFFSPFKGTIYSIGFIESFGIIEGFKHLIKQLTNEKEDDSELKPPTLICPLLESSNHIRGRAASGETTVVIYINNKPEYVIDAEGEYFDCEVDGKLNVGDMVSAKQINDKSKASTLSPAITVSDNDLKIAKIEMDKENQKICLIESSTEVLISWSVLIIGGLSYVILFKRKTVRLLWTIPLVIFLIVLSIYYGISTKHAIISCVNECMPVLSTTNVHVYWWNQIELFQRGLFLACIFLLWNLGASSKIKE